MVSTTIRRRLLEFSVFVLGSIILSDNRATGQSAPMETDELPPLRMKELSGKWKGGVKQKFGYTELNIALDLNEMGSNPTAGNWQIEYGIQDPPPAGATGLVGLNSKSGAIGLAMVPVDDNQTDGVLLRVRTVDGSRRDIGSLTRGKGDTLRLTINQEAAKIWKDLFPVEGLILRRVEDR